MSTTKLAARAGLVRHGLRLEYLTVGWNVVEGGVGIAAALAAGSVALLGFGVDSFVESASGLVLVWRLRAEHHGTLDEPAIERVERWAERLVALSLGLLAVFIAADAVSSLATGERPDSSLVGIVVTSAALVVMGFLARAKRRTGEALGSRALIADAFQTTTCLWLSATTLAGLAANALLGWWWADPLAALGIVVLVAREALEAWGGEEEADGGEDATVRSPGRIDKRRAEASHAAELPAPSVDPIRDRGAPVRPRVELLWFPDCPNHLAARALLREVLAELAPETPIVEIDASDPEVAQRHRFPGSPTIRVDGRDVDPAFVDPGDYTPRCRLYPTPEGLRRIPERAWIEAALRGALRR